MRFCTSCRSNREEDGGQYKKCNRTARWVCLHCLNRTAESIYKADKPTDVKFLGKVKKQLGYV